jgi:hypothetical protein
VDDERISWPVDSIELTKSEVLGLVLPALDAAIDEIAVSMLRSDLVEIRSIDSGAIAGFRDGSVVKVRVDDLALLTPRPSA